MREALLLSYFCPKFSVFQAQAYENVYGFDSKITVENLRGMRCDLAATWIDDRGRQWESLKSEGLRWREKELKGQFEILSWGENKYPKI